MEPDRQLEWDEAKRLSNLVKHGIDFLDAGAVFSADPVIRPGRSVADERRWLAIGMSLGHLITVVYTLRDTTTIRIISARRARTDERREYRQIHG